MKKCTGINTIMLAKFHHHYSSAHNKQGGIGFYKQVKGGVKTWNIKYKMGGITFNGMGEVTIQNMYKNRWIRTFYHLPWES